MLDLGEIQVCWICGLPYARKHDQGRAEIELLAAPVMRHPRYGGKPVYYSDITVHRSVSKTVRRDPIREMDSIAAGVQW